MTDGNNLDEMPVYSPDGNYLLFKRGTANPEIYQLRIDNSSLTNLTNNSDVDDAPMYSYDGTKIVWMQSSTGMNSAEVWIMNSDGTNKTQLTSNSVADFNPSFAPFTQTTGPEINIKGNDQDIQSGDATPSTLDYTDFGSTSVDVGFLTRTFTIENSGNQNLSLSGNPIVQITGTKYHYRVKAYNESSTSGNSNTITLTTLPNAPNAPTAAAATLILQTNFTTNWNAVVGATGYYLDVSTENNFSSFVTGYKNKNVGNVNSIIADTNLSANTSFYYRVRSYNAGGTSNNSNTISITLVGIDNYTNLPTEYELKQNFPNPFNPSTTIKYALPVDSKVVIKIYDILGQEVALLKDEIIFARNYEIQFNSSNLPGGVYFYRLSAESLNGKQKFSSIKKMILLK